MFWCSASALYFQHNHLIGILSCYYMRLPEKQQNCVNAVMVCGVCDVWCLVKMELSTYNPPSQHSDQNVVKI